MQFEITNEMTIEGVSFVSLPCTAQTDYDNLPPVLFWDSVSYGKSKMLNGKCYYRNDLGVNLQ